jgi:hypothetical protein
MIRIGRRSLLAAFGATVAAMGLRPRRVDARAVPTHRGTGRWLVDASLDARDRAVPDDQSATTLDADLVRQWRSGLGQRLCADRRGATALVRWDKAFVLQGLAREAGMRACVERVSPAVFRVILVARA